MSTQDLEQPSSGTDGAATADPILAAAGRRRRPLDPVLLERLAETGFLATEFGMDAHAERIFESLARLKPGKPSPRIALAMVQARRGEVKPAIAALRQLLDEQPECELARAVLGTMLVHIGDPVAGELLDGVVARASDPAAVSVAQSCLEQAAVASAQVTARDDHTVEFFRHHNVRL